MCTYDYQSQPRSQSINPINLSIYLSIYQSINPIYLSINQSINQAIHPSNLSNCPSINLSSCLIINLSIYQSIKLSNYQSINQYISYQSSFLSIHPSIHLNQVSQIHSLSQLPYCLSMLLSESGVIALKFDKLSTPVLGGVPLAVGPSALDLK